MGHEQRRGAALGQPVHRVLPHCGSRVHVDRSEGLVEQCHLRLGDERPGHGNPLRLTTGERVRIHVGVGLEFEGRELGGGSFTSG